MKESAAGRAKYDSAYRGASRLEYRQLGKTGLAVSVIGFGASPFGSVFREVTPEECVRATHAAIAHGINYFDVSPYYGLTLAEERLGAALAGKREQVFLATKCGRYGYREFDFSEKRVLSSIDESLSRLRTDYVDLYQVHDIDFVDVETVINETLPAMWKVKESGKCRFIGITGYLLDRLLAVASQQSIDAVLSYCHYNLLITDMETALTPLCRARGLGLINASPLHMALLTDHDLPSWHPAPPEVRQAGRQVVAACKEAGVNPAVVALRFCLDHPYVSTTLVGMASEQHVEENIKALTYKPDPALMKKIEALVSPVKDYVWPEGQAVMGN